MIMSCHLKFQKRSPYWDSGFKIIILSSCEIALFDFNLTQVKVGKMNKISQVLKIEMIRVNQSFRTFTSHK